MAIVKLEKFNLILFKNDVNRLLKDFQKFEEIDFRVTDFELKNYVSKDLENIENTIIKLESLIKKLRILTPKKSTFKTLKEGLYEFSYDELENYVKKLDIEKTILDISSKFILKDKVLKQNESLKNNILEYEDWKNLDISFSDLKRLKMVDITIGTLTKKNFEKMLQEIDDTVEVNVISECKKNINVLIYSSKESNFKEVVKEINLTKFNLDITEIPVKMIEKLKKNIQENIKVLEEIDIELKEYALNISDLEIATEYYRNILLKENTKEIFKETDKLSIVSAYIPKTRKDELESLLNNLLCKDYYITYEEFDVNDSDIPVKLKNNTIIEPYEMLVGTYSLPKYTEIDPTLIVAPFFWLFFGMMMADVGYGLILSIATGFALSIFNLNKSNKNMMKFVFMLGISTTLWGLIYGSLFGFDFDNPLHIYSPTVNYQPVMILSFVFGIIHIFLALLTKAYILIRDKKYFDCFSDVFLWMVTLTSTGYYIFARFGNMSGILVDISKYLMILTMLGIVATGGREAKSIGGKIGLGTYALYGISGYMGDLISYVRLMALGLSGGYIAYSVNTIAQMVGNKGIMIIFMVLIMVLGHGFNLFLSALGAYVHTSRLIYVEFFAKFYEGGGKAFNNFKIKEKYINIKNN
ncbi:MAG: V-type ATP synthase subunit I [Streptobacillus sp.]